MSGYSCPFCPRWHDWSASLDELLRRAYEEHLDAHMARGDQLLEPLPRAS